MDEDQKEIIKAIAEGAAEGVSKKIPPLYVDLLQPSVREIGKGLSSVIKLALSPVTISIWAYDQIGNWLTDELTLRLSNVSEENISSPSASIVGPAIESLKFLGDEPDIRDLFAQLIAASMNANTKSNVHPGFVETLKNLSGLDARLLNYLYFNNKILYADIIYCTPNEDVWYKFVSEINPGNLKSDEMVLSISNLSRLGIVEPYERFVDGEMGEFTTKNRAILDSIPTDSKNIYKYNRCQLTNYGNLLCKTCIEPL
jgi:hypothetical protein